MHLGLDCAVEDFIICRFRNYYSASSTRLRSRPVSFPPCYQNAVMNALKSTGCWMLRWVGPGMEEVGFLENWGLGGDTPPPGFPTWRGGLGAESLGSGSSCTPLFLDRKGQGRQVAWANSSLPSPAQPPPPSRPGAVPAESV